MGIDLLIAGVVGFLSGSLPFATIVAKAMKLPDPRSYGSGNPGASNVLRSGNKWAGRLVFALDLLKGVLPVVACAMLLETDDVGSLAGFAAVAGHVWSPWLRFKGGKGVATGFGALLGIDWRLFLLSIAVWVVIYFALRTVSVGSVASFIAAMIASAWLYEFGSYPAVATAGMAMVITIRHRQNLADLKAGKERKF